MNRIDLKHPAFCDEDFALWSAEQAALLAESSSLKRYPQSVVAREYALARLHASGETSLVESSFPKACPYSIEKILDPTFLPGPEDK